MIEHDQDLHIGGSIVRVSSTNEEGVVTSVQDDLVSIKVRKEHKTFTKQELEYLGTPGLDCPYLDDIL